MDTHHSFILERLQTFPCETGKSPLAKKNHYKKIIEEVRRRSDDFKDISYNYHSESGSEDSYEWDVGDHDDSSIDNTDEMVNESIIKKDE